jgi:hypothetical protein
MAGLTPTHFAPRQGVTCSALFGSSLKLYDGISPFCVHESVVAQ